MRATGRWAVLALPSVMAGSLGNHSQPFSLYPLEGEARVIADAKRNESMAIFKAGIYYGSGCEADYRSMPACKQYESEWCWATAVSEIAGYYGHGPTGNDCHGYECDVASWKTGHHCCDHKSSGCDQAGSDSDITGGLQYLGVDGWKCHGPLRQDELDEKLQEGPLIFGVAWSGGGGHSMTIGGCSDGHYYVHNPLTYAGQWKTVTYDHLMYYYYDGDEGTWDQTCYPSSPSPSPSPHEDRRRRSHHEDRRRRSHHHENSKPNFNATMVVV